MLLKTDRLSSMCEAVIDCPHSTPVWTDAGFVVLRNQNIKSGRLDLSQPSFTDEIHFKQRIRRLAPRAGDIVITREAPMGEVCKIPEGLVCCLGQRQVLLRPKPSVDPDYLLYALQSKFVQDQIQWNEGTGSTVSNIRIPVLEKIEIPRHGDRETGIAAMLSALDAKIDVNRCINQTLESMAQAIFTSWFVNFDPVKAKIVAKAEGRDSLRAAMSAISGKPDAELESLSPEQFERLIATASLFPDEMDESDLGCIPKGWKCQSLSKMANFIGGGTPKRSEPTFWNGSIPWFSVKDAPVDGDVFVIETEEHITDEGLRRSTTRLLPPGVTIISARGTVGKLALVGVPMAMNQSCYGVQGLDGAGPYFNYFNLKVAIDKLKQNTHGAVFDTITLSTFDAVLGVSPKHGVIAAFESAVGPLLDQIQLNLKETRILKALRNALLPKLLSGELAGCMEPDASDALEAT